MNCSNESLDQLIFDYLFMVDKATALLEEKFGSRCILRLWRTNKIERCGTIIGDITYELHGVGCAVYFPDLCVDFDYGPDGRTDGFDVWRLYIFACELPTKYKKYADKKVLETDFNGYLTLGKFERMSKSPGELYCLRTD
ncbi:hypothetical protein HNR03_004367 [Pseudomonas sp. JAI111]|uniref:DUF6896 domain-containing protein n=1 Tax=Pseudomonas sp. JAI111 TaxID=2735913 RepID=UPI0038621CCD|nr:hypothetical protein [Pseudomonas sp. JAI111]